MKRQENNSGILGFLLKHHIAKSEKGANIILTVVALIFIALSIGLIVWNNILNKREPKPIYKISADLFKKLPPEMQTKLLE